MASLDKMEGETVQIAALALVLIVAFIAWKAYKLSGKIPSLAEVLAQVEAMLKAALRGFVPAFPVMNSPSGSLGDAQVYTGTAQGLNDPSSYAVTQGETLDYQIPYETVN